MEVKCPYSFRNDKLSDKNNTKYIIYYDDDGNLVLNNNHYYDQIQGALHILEKIVVNIEYDESWKENLELLENFYIEHYSPKLLKN